MRLYKGILKLLCSSCKRQTTWRLLGPLFILTWASISFFCWPILNNASFTYSHSLQILREGTSHTILPIPRPLSQLVILLSALQTSTSSRSVILELPFLESSNLNQCSKFNPLFFRWPLDDPKQSPFLPNSFMHNLRYHTLNFAHHPSAQGLWVYLNGDLPVVYTGTKLVREPSRLSTWPSRNDV